MSDSHNDSIVLLKDKVRRIIDLYEKEKEKNSKLLSENRMLDGQVKNIEQKLNDLKAQYDKLKIAKTIMASSEDAHEAKLKVNRMVREIDRCIALLNR